MLVCENIRKSFGRHMVLNNINLNLRPNAITGLVGPDGAGKTTLMRIVCGLIIADSGRIHFALSPGPGNKPGYMPQNFSLYTDLSVLENIEFLAALYGIDPITARERAGQVLAFTRLEPFKQRLAGQLSGGMKQKLALACALLTRPALLLLDEPTYGVDPESRQEFWQLLYQLNQDGMTVLVSTPYMDEAELCHEVALINEGRLVALDSPAGLKARLGHRLLEARVALKDPHFFAGLPGVLESSFFGDRYHLLVERMDASRPVIEAHLRDRGVTAQSIREIEPSMEDVFVFLAESGS